jgi:hypothetical protein
MCSGVAFDLAAGRRRSSQPGIHQFLEPSRSMVAGTISMRIKVASSSTATARL